MSKSVARGSPSLQELLPRNRKRVRAAISDTSARKKRKSLSSDSGSDSDLDTYSDAIDDTINGTDNPSEIESKLEVEEKETGKELPLRSRLQNDGAKIDNGLKSKLVIPAKTEESIKRSGHIRFGSEERIDTTIEETPQSIAVPDTFEAASEDEDEAPEAVTISTAQKKAKAVAKGANEAVKSQNEELRRKRKERNARLKVQAEASSKRQKQRHTQVRETLPDLLPAEILNSTPFERPPTPDAIEPVGTKSLDLTYTKGRKIRLDTEPTQKDRKIGQLRVRVLDKLNETLAPKYNAKSRAIRENMLKGRRTKRGPVYERVKSTKGFLVT